MFEEALAGGGENYTETIFMEVSLKTTATRQEEAGQGQSVWVSPQLQAPW